MLFLQHLIGIVVFLGITSIAFYVTHEEGRDIHGKYQLVPCLTTFAGTFFGIYAMLGLFCGIFWCIAWIGILIRTIFQWLLEAIFYVPMLWV